MFHCGMFQHMSVYLLTKQKFKLYKNKANLILMCIKLCVVVYYKRRH